MPICECRRCELLQRRLDEARDRIGELELRLEGALEREQRQAKNGCRTEAEEHRLSLETRRANCAPVVRSTARSAGAYRVNPVQTGPISKNGSEEY